MRVRPAVAALLIAVCTLSACSDSAAPEQPAHFDLLVSTDKPAYSSTVDRTVAVSVENRSNRKVYLPADFYVVTERMVQGGWGDPFAWFFAGGSSTDWIALEPGSTRLNSLPLLYYAGARTALRVKYFVYEDATLSRPLPIELRVSTSFQLAP
jgi:hypothetical protein